MPFEKKCAHCGKAFTAERSAAKYCNRQCAGLARKKPVQMIECLTCGKRFFPRKCSESRRYCSRKCYRASQVGRPHPSLKNRPVLTCGMCGRSFTCPPSQAERRRFCSTECFYEWLNGSERAPRVKFACPVCGKTVRMLESKYEDGRQHYCSQECMMKDRPPTPTVDKIVCTCEQCGEVFERYPSQIKNGEGRFCSRSCVYKYINRRAGTNNPTSIERAMLAELDHRNIGYEFQYVFDSYVLDFAFPDHHLAVEADGIYWHSLENVMEKDARKDADLAKQGWAVLHFTGDEIRQSVSACVDEIVEHLS